MTAVGSTGFSATWTNPNTNGVATSGKLTYKKGNEQAVEEQLSSTELEKGSHTKAINGLTASTQYTVNVCISDGKAKAEVCAGEKTVTTDADGGAGPSESISSAQDEYNQLAQ